MVALVGRLSTNVIIMFQTFSMTGTGVYILAINLVLQLLAYFGVGIDVLPGQIEEIASGVAALVGVVLAVIGQNRRKDLVGGLVRKA